jgi:aminopeptidase
VIPESAKPLLIPLQQSILQVGAHPLIQYLPHGVNKPFFEHASQRQLTYTSESYLRERVATIDHQISIIAHRDKRELAGVDPAKIFARSEAMKYYKEALEAKENQHGFSRTVGLYGTEAMAQEAGLSLEAYWQQIIKACYLDFEKPIAERKKIADEITCIKDHLDRLQLDSLHIKGKDVDLKIKL